MATNANHLYKPSAARMLVLDGFVPGPRGGRTPNPLSAIPLPSWPAKDPGDVLDYQFDIAPALSGNDGDAVATLDVAISPSNPGDLALASAAADGARAVLWLGGGVAGTIYSVTITLGTQAGRVLSRTVLLPVLALSTGSGGGLGTGGVGTGGLNTGGSVTGALTDETGALLVDEAGNPLLLGI